MKTGIELIAEERKRQIEIEGWTIEHDDEHPACNMALAGACYAVNVAATYGKGKALQEMCDRLSKIVWPWDKKWWKPTPKDPIKQLVKAGALIAAEIDRFQRNRGKVLRHRC